jgi:hypothetical protein
MKQILEDLMFSSWFYHYKERQVWNETAEKADLKKLYKILKKLYKISNPD